VDEDYQIVRRFDVTLDQRRRCDLFWSPDERVAICRSFRSDMEPISNHCTFFRVDLDTGDRGDTKRGIDGDKFHFSGVGSEVIRVGITGVPPNGYGDGTYGAYIEIMPDGNGNEREIHRFDGRWLPVDWHRQFYPAVICNRDCTLFAMALRRTKGQTAGFHYHLIDRSGGKWPFPPDDAAQFITPYIPITFANNDRSIIARNGSQLFSVPVATIKESNEPTNE
jgi:hypothetical protein